MRSHGSPFSRFLTGLTVGALIAFVLSGIAVKAFKARGIPPKPPLLLKQRFDFRALRSSDQPWKGPALGEKIDLAKLKAADGSEITRLLDGQPIMLASINPACGMCKVARDEMLFIRDHIVPLGVQYHPVCFSPVDSSINFYEYAKLLGLNDPAFEWQGKASPAQSILDMTVPSHLLVDQDGIVLQVWPGSSADNEVRQRMGAQIVDDVQIINEVFRAGRSSRDSKPRHPR